MATHVPVTWPGQTAVTQSTEHVTAALAGREITAHKMLMNVSGMLLFDHKSINCKNIQ